MAVLDRLYRFAASYPQQALAVGSSASGLQEGEPLGDLTAGRAKAPETGRRCAESGTQEGATLLFPHHFWKLLGLRCSTFTLCRSILRRRDLPIHPRQLHELLCSGAKLEESVVSLVPHLPPFSPLHCAPKGQKHDLAKVKSYPEGCAFLRNLAYSSTHKPGLRYLSSLDPSPQ